MNFEQKMRYSEKNPEQEAERQFQWTEDNAVGIRERRDCSDNLS